MKYNLTYSMYSHLGGRPVNEDSAGVVTTQNGMCFVLCDGLGGHGMGDVASSVVCESIKEQFAQAENAYDFLAPAVTNAQHTLMQKQVELHAKKKMKTTATILATDDKKAYICHVGDSRLYAFRKNKVCFRTLDHSIPQMLVMSGEIKEEEIRNHPERNILLKVMGVEWDKPAFELHKPIPLRKCDAFLLCSDGFWELINEDEMCDALKNSTNAEEWLKKMRTVVADRASQKNADNNTAIAIWVQSVRR